MRRRDVNVVYGVLAFVTAFCVVLTFIVAGDHRTITAQGHAAIQQNVNARYDDCRAGDSVRARLYAKVKLARTTSDPLLFKLLPSLDTPAVHRLVAESEAKDLMTFRPRGVRGCKAYALKSVPPRSRGNYQVP